MAGQEMRGHLDPAEVNREIQFARRVGDTLGSEDPYFVDSIATRIRTHRLFEEINDLIDRLEQEREEEPQDPSRHPAFPFEMSHDIPADTGLTEPNEVTITPSGNRPVQIDGIVLGAADGAANAVGLRLTTDDGDRLIPRNFDDEYMNIPGGFSDMALLRYKLSPDESLVAETVNLDENESHFVVIQPQGVVLPRDEPEGDGPPDEPGEPGGDR